MDRRRYEAILLGRYLPDTVIATKESSSGSDWRQGDERSLLHQCWQLCTDDRSIKKDNVVFEVAFDSVVDRNGFTLDEEEALADNLTKKLFCLWKLKGSKSATGSGANQVYRTSLFFDWFLRWRNSIHVGRNNALEPDDLADYVGRLTDDVLSLVPALERLEQIYGASWQDHDASDGTSSEGSMPSLASRLGVSANSLAASRRFQAALREIGHPLARKLVADATAAADPLDWQQQAQTGTDRDHSRKKASAHKIQGFLNIWATLDEMSRAGELAHDPLLFRPFKTTSMHALAKRLGRPGGAHSHP